MAATRPRTGPAKPDIVQDIDWLVPVDQRFLTTNRWHTGHRPSQVRPIELVVVHYTTSSFQSALSWLRNPTSNASAHFIIGRDGQIAQLAPLCDRTWHAGGGTAAWRHQPSVNGKSIGVELENLGRLTQRDETIFDAYERVYTGPTVEAPDHRGTMSVWQPYTDVQIATLKTILRRIAEVFPIITTAGDRIAGHYEIDPTRKFDPGPEPVFPWTAVRAAVRE